ncbi:hypothetical protein DL89DRAFT_291387 [Linderina pennispora]|uniref:FAD-binding FR-type domain-containing protein n=1 Tax=Linderina pennispora TaxID=61395 RepID=A0A1Y1WF75_9FUNG|nr:uncharacterized protein DL89DRAFT_291387 [Linderina pennispora]ORX72163.1 hypothetical protein DL89DRAFT_291387 [Linderina pennispora]
MTQPDEKTSPSSLGSSTSFSPIQDAQKPEESQRSHYQRLKTPTSQIPSGSNVGQTQRRHLFPPLYPCHFKDAACRLHGCHSPHDLPEGLNQATQYGILTSVMAILVAMSPTFIGLLRRTPLDNVFTFEKRVHAHKFISYILFLWTIAHVSLHYYTGVGYAEEIHAARWFVFWGDRLGITGQLMWMFYLFLGIAALPPVRRAYYEAFYYLHHLFFVNIVMLYLHSENGKAEKYVTGPLVIFLADYLYRALRSYPVIWSRRARIRYVRLHQSDVVEIGFDRKELWQHTRTGQYVKICVPELGIFQWHPFTLTATPSECKVLADGKSHELWRIHFKVVGNWTKQFAQRLQKVTAGGDIYNNAYDQEARIGRVVNDVVVPEVMPIDCDEEDAEYIMAIANRIDSGDSGVAVAANASDARMLGGEQVAVEMESAMLSTGHVRREVLVPKKSAFDPMSPSSSSDSAFDQAWGEATFSGTQAQALLPTILVDGPYNAPMESFFEQKASIIIAAGIGITPNRIPVRTTQTTREDLLPQSIYLVWVFRDISMINILMDTLKRLRDHRRARDIVVPCLYVTGQVGFGLRKHTLRCVWRPMVRLSNGIRLSLGRPPLRRMIPHMASKHENSRIGVFCCASKELTSQVRTTVHDTNAAISHLGTDMVMRAECFSM